MLLASKVIKFAFRYWMLGFVCWIRLCIAVGWPLAADGSRATLKMSEKQRKEPR